MPPLYLVSDIHAGIRGDADDASRLADFETLLARARAAGGELAILGDLFDFWFEWREVVPSRHLPWLGALDRAVRGGLAISVLPGNHDFKLGGLLEERLGLRHPGEDERRLVDGMRVVLHHGDGLDPGERGYRLMRHVFRSGWAQWGFRWLHPDLGMRLADWMGAGDRDRVWDGDFLAGYLRRSLPGVLREDDDLFAMGHVHVAGRFRWGRTTVLTLPPFVAAARGYAVVEDGAARLEFLRPERAPVVVEETLR
jgi:UDP-2,3-diacylglucosamine hydrolase